MPDSPPKTNNKWQRPADVLKLQQLKIKKRNLQNRIKGSPVINTSKSVDIFENVLSKQKRKNPFAIKENVKKTKSTTSPIDIDATSDQTLFELLHGNRTSINNKKVYTSFDNILNKINDDTELVEIVKAHGEKWLPIDWSLRSKLRLLSFEPFPWNQKLKLSEEASGITGFTRCLGTNSTTYLDESPNAKFYQNCLYWQQPSLPWLKLFPRSTNKSSGGTNIMNNTEIRDSLQNAWFDSLRSLFQLIRTRQCPYFYVCANNFTVLFRAAGICGFSDVHVLVTPTTRGFRKLLKTEDIEFDMPLKKKRQSDQGYETMDSTCTETQDVSEKENLDESDDDNDDTWLQSIGINLDDIKKIKYTQQKINHKTECEIDHSEQSLILIKGTEVHSFYNFLMNCKSAIAISGPLAGIPPTLLAPVAFNGATLQSLKLRESKVKLDDVNYYSLELTGPILPTMIHNLFNMHQPEHSLTVTFHNLNSTTPFSKVQPDTENKTKGETVFEKENLSDCGLNNEIIQHICHYGSKHVSIIECCKFDSDTKSYTWT